MSGVDLDHAFPFHAIYDLGDIVPSDIDSLSYPFLGNGRRSVRILLIPLVCQEVQDDPLTHGKQGLPGGAVHQARMRILGIKCF